MSTPYRIVLTTFSKEETGAKIVDALLAAKLAACIQTLPIASTYVWKGKRTREKEQMMLIKARASDYAEIESTLLRLHDYEIPEIVCLPIERGLAGYLDWIGESTHHETP